MIRRTTLVFAVCLSVVWGQAFAQAPTELLGESTEVSDGGRSGSGDIVFMADFGAFRGPEGMTKEEVYFQLHTVQLSFLEGIGSHRATFEVGLTLTSATGDTAGNHVWGRMVEMRTEEETLNQTKAIQDQFVFYANPGKYDVRVWVTDRESQLSGSYEGQLEVPGFESDQVILSEVQLAANIDAAGQSEAFMKQGVQVDPNVNRVISTKDSVVHFYYECYNLSEANGSVSVAYSIEDEEGYPLANEQKRFRLAGQSFARAESIAIQGAEPEPGVHYLKVQVRDDVSKKMTSSERSFSVVKPLASQVLATDEASLERYYKQIRYVAEQGELDTYKGLGPEDKAAFIIEFWRKRDLTPETRLNEFAEEHYRRIRYANDRFSAAGGMRGSEGIDTDMGRIYIKYGPPDDIERELNPGSSTSSQDIVVGGPQGGSSLFSTSGTSGVSGGSFGDKPYEIWTFNRLGGYIFIFRDRTSMGVFELVHTTHPQESPFNPDWARTSN